MDEAHVCMAQDGLASLQIILNIFRQKPIRSLFAEAARKHVGIIVRLPLASGLLSGTMTTTRAFPDNDHRKYNRDGQHFNIGETFAGLPFERGVALADGLKSIVPSGMSMAEMAQRWILDYAAVSTVITGASKPEQARANARVSELTSLSPELHATLAEYYTHEVAPHIRGPY
jgi:aryl-alcohol dehydrogenase-like predicted oxidoreductase